MIRLIALTAAGIAMMILGIVVREERLAARGRVPMGRLRRLLPGPDRRKFPRWRVDYPIRYQRLPDGAGRRPAAPKDVSLGGARLVIQEILERGALIRVEGTLPESQTSFEAEGRIVWSRELPAPNDPAAPRNFMIGVEFLTTPETLRKDLEARQHRR
ncbi:MAG: hypothetical protein COV76_02220 [Candidatus Omnitrophica bacterium CG11_big_fil_rev_8_21_14_0_20_64_10]|nr:MAG: hypothetical protein COV76_02220 [Candidatus Omnitrophica bacterium CG11_big_fil_rev_8_21_14_0_20_64_10]